MTTHFMVGPSWLTLAVWVDPVCSMANVGGTEKKGQASSSTRQHAVKLYPIFSIKRSMATTMR